MEGRKIVKDGAAIYIVAILDADVYRHFIDGEGKIAIWQRRAFYGIARWTTDNKVTFDYFIAGDTKTACKFCFRQSSSVLIGDG